MNNNSLKTKTTGIVGSFSVGLLFITSFFTGCWYVLNWMFPMLSIHFITVFHAFVFTGGMILLIPFFFFIEVIVSIFFKKIKWKPSMITAFFTKVSGALIMVLIVFQLDKWVGGIEFSQLGTIIISFILFLFTEFLIWFSSNLYVLAIQKNKEEQKKRS